MVGLSRSRVSEVLSENRVITPKADTPRKTVRYEISQYTKPATAAEKIRATFGPDFARQLKDALASSRTALRYSISRVGQLLSEMKRTTPQEKSSAMNLPRSFPEGMNVGATKPPPGHPPFK